MIPMYALPPEDAPDDDWRRGINTYLKPTPATGVFVHRINSNRAKKIDAERVVKLHQQGMSVDGIVAELGSSTRAVERALKADRADG